jgi:Permuted papain-like amidase enzyme, YaeF/YiiX, C92 family
MTRLIIYRGPFDPWHRRDATGFNNTGYVTADDMVIHPRRSRIATTPLAKIVKRPHRLIQLPNLPHAQQIETFFTKNIINNTLYVIALQQIPNANSSFWRSPIKVPILEPISAEEHELRWKKMKSVLQRGDGIFVIDAESLASRIIAYLDQGTWSHVGTYSGNGQIVEAITSGVVERSMEAYHHRRYRLGAYRLPGATAEQIDTLISFARTQIGGGYNYRGAITLGLRLALGIWPTAGAAHTTPNMMLGIAGYELLKLV